MKNLRKLSRGAMKTVNGGLGRCAMKVTAGGSTTVHMQYFPGDGDAQSSAASAECSRLVSTQGNGVTRCQYDCEYDGLGN